MAVLVEGISVVVRRDSIERKVSGGHTRIRRLIPNATYCADDELVRVGFLVPDEVREFIDELKEVGLTFVDEGKCVDIAVCDQQRGLTNDCDWLEFCHLKTEEGKVGAAWLYEGDRKAHGLHFSSTSMTLATPHGWEFKGSLSEKFAFIPDGVTRQ